VIEFCFCLFNIKTSINVDNDFYHKCANNVLTMNYMLAPRFTIIQVPRVFTITYL